MGQLLAQVIHFEVNGCWDFRDDQQHIVSDVLEI